jgi:hypothetical protein
MPLFGKVKRETEFTLTRKDKARPLTLWALWSLDLGRIPRSPINAFSFGHTFSFQLSSKYLNWGYTNNRINVILPVNSIISCLTIKNGTENKEFLAIPIW